MLRITVCSLFVVCALGAAGCRNTWNGVKQDSRTAVEKTGHGLQKAGTKIENSVKK